MRQGDCLSWPSPGFGGPVDPTWKDVKGALLLGAENRADVKHRWGHLVTPNLAERKLLAELPKESESAVPSMGLAFSLCSWPSLWPRTSIPSSERAHVSQGPSPCHLPEAFAQPWGPDLISHSKAPF